MEHVFIRSGLFHHFAGEENRAGRRKGHVLALIARTRASGYVIELAGMTANIVSRM